MLTVGAALLALIVPHQDDVLKLGSPFTDHAVMQQLTTTVIWGWGKPGERVTIKAGWGAQARATTGPDGRWRTNLKTTAAGGPYEVTVTGDSSITLKDVMLGEVWVCSGQSNMEMEVKKPYPPDLPNQADVIKNANHPNMRLFLVPNKMSAGEQETCDAQWRVCTSETVQTFSACGYFFGKELLAEVGVPIGLIDATWGGTEVELWTSESGLRRIPDLNASIESGAASRVAYESGMRNYQAAIQAADKGWNEWNRAELNDSDWTTIAKASPFEANGLQAFDGVAWYRATVDVPADMNLAGAKLDLGPIDDEDQSFVNGTRIGGLNVWDAHRTYDVPATLLKTGSNSIAVRCFDGAGLGGFNGKVEPALVVGSKRLPLKNWKLKVSANLADLPKPPSAPKSYSTLYNGMIAPIVPYGIRGAIWYQGESNVGRAWQYRLSFPNMILDWREAFGRKDFPFYYVQIAPFAYNSGLASAELRDAQLATLTKIPKVGMAVTTDITENVRDIHPIQKEPVGKRLALWALAKDYGKQVAFSGPVYKSSRIDGALVRVKFDHANGGLALKGDAVGFQICAWDGKFVDAKARIEKDELVIFSDAVSAPVAARFAYGDAVIGNLFNGVGLPASPFRTDQFPAQTKDVKW